MGHSLAVSNLPIEADIPPKKDRLKEIIKEKSFKTGSFRLASGASSEYLFDLKTTLLSPEGVNLCADLILEIIPENIDAVGGLELGACPIVSAVCVKSYPERETLGAFYVRKAKKERGTQQLIEGYSLTDGDKVIILDDVTTKGGSVMDAIRAVQNQGCEIVKVLSVVDRQEGAKENLAKEGIELESIFTTSDFI